MYYSNSTIICNTKSVFFSLNCNISDFLLFAHLLYEQGIWGLPPFLERNFLVYFQALPFFFGGTKIFSLLLFSYFDCRRQKKITKSNNFQLSLQSPVIFLLKTYCSPYLYPPLLHHPAVHSFLSVSTFRRSFHGGFPLYGDDRYVLPPPTTSLLQTDHSIYYWSTVNNLGNGCIIPSISNCWSGFMHYVPLESCYFYWPLGMLKLSAIEDNG